MSFYLKDGEILWPTEEGVYDLRNTLPVGTYTVGQHPQKGFFLKSISDFNISGKIYGKTTRHAERILNTFASRPASTGVMLNGEKGSGKTMLAKLVSQKGAEQGIPTLVINTPFTGDSFNTFIQSINEPCIIVFDEFEKVFDKDDQEATLTLLDGVYPSKKLFILTCNDVYRVNQHMTNRPGRIFYKLDFKGLDLEFIREYCDDNLNDKSQTTQVCRLTSVYDSFNFDMLKALVEEMNRYSESPTEALEMLNAKPFTAEDSSRYNVRIIEDGTELTPDMIDPVVMRGNPIAKQEMTFYIDKEPDNMDSNNSVIEIHQNQLTKIDPDAGTFTYMVNEGPKTTVLVFTKEKYKAVGDWRDAF